MTVQRLMTSLARAMALLGGLVLISLVILTCLSILGRIANTLGHADSIEAMLPFLVGPLRALGPINGDYELVEAGIAFAIFAFLPWCQLNRGHANVEVLTGFFPRVANRFLAALWEIIFALVILLITWRISVGMSDKMRYGETTFLLQMPVWWAFAICTAAAVVASVVAIYSAWLHTQELFQTPSSQPPSGSADP